MRQRTVRICGEESNYLRTGPFKSVVQIPIRLLLEKMEIVASAINMLCNDCVRRSNKWMKKMMKNFYRLGSNQMMHRIGVTVGAAIMMAGCASIPAPTEQMAVSRAAVSNATSAGGGEFAPLQLKSAMDKMDAAQRAMLAEDYVLARQLAEQAQVDAQLATAVARSAKARKAAEALQEDSRVLRQEIDRKTK